MDTVLPFVSDMHSINDEAVLFQAGYLTIDSIEESSGSLKYALRPPNLEVGHAIVQEFIKKEGMLKKYSDTINTKYGGFVDAFDSLDEVECSLSFASCMSELVTYFQVQTEIVPQVLMYTLLNVKEPRVSMEKNIGDGRADLFYTSPKGHIIVIEIKFQKKPSASSRYCMPGTAEPVSDLPSVIMLPEQEKRQDELDKEIAILEKGIAVAFDQIDQRKYTLPFYKSSEKVYAAAVSVCGSSDVMIRFREETWEKFIRRAAGARESEIPDLDPCS
jgi:hypothetical protein